MADINGTENTDTLSGTKDADVIKGAGGNDILWGLDGDDHIIGGLGRDHLIGGPGADTFEYNSVSESPYLDGDIITDFNRLEGDKIDLSSIDADRTLDGNQAFASSQMSYDFTTGYFTAEVLGGAVLEIEFWSNTVFDPAKDVITFPVFIDLGIPENILDTIIDISAIGKFAPDILLLDPVCLSCPTVDSTYDIFSGGPQPDPPIHNFYGGPTPEVSINFYDDVLLDNVSHNVDLIGNLSLVDTFDVIF